MFPIMVGRPTVQKYFERRGQPPRDCGSLPNISMANKRRKTQEDSLYLTDYQKYGLEPLQSIAFENVPKDASGTPYGIIGRTSVAVNGETFAVDIFNDTDHNEGACVLPNGTRGKIPQDKYEQMLHAFDEQIAAAKKEEITGRAEARVKNNAPAKAERKAKKNAKGASPDVVAGDESVKEYNKEKRQKRTALLIYVAAVLLVVLAAKFMLDGQQKTVNVIRLKTDMVSGDVLTESFIEPYSMLESVYNSLGKTTYMSNGQQVSQQTMLTWDQRDEVVGKYMSYYTQAGQILTSRHVTDETTTRNPWLAKVTDEREVYTLAFNASDVNTSLLYPGCHMRVRIVAQTTAGDGTSTGASESLSGLTESDGMMIMDQDALAEAGINAPSVGVVFSDLQAIDMLNSSNQSIYELYMALLRLPLDERVEYINTKLTDNQTADNFRTMVTPNKLVFLLTKEQADTLAKFEGITDSKFKFTIIVNSVNAEEDDGFVSSLIDITDQINKLAGVS